MNFYRNIPCNQRFAQKLIDNFNEDEILWNRLEVRRKDRRKKLNISEMLQRALDILEFESKRHPDDCIGMNI